MQNPEFQLPSAAFLLPARHREEFLEYIKGPRLHKTVQLTV